MSNVKMPEPVGANMYVLDEVGNLVPSGFTSDQMEAYANSRVREALEEAARICDAKSEKSGQASQLEDDHEEQIILQSEAWKFLVLAHEIRALIPKETI